MKKLKQFTDGSLVLLIAAAGLTGWTMFSDHDQETHYPSEERIVVKGDSIWSIAENVSGNIDLQLEETVHWMKNENELEGEVIHPGQTIQVPAEWNGVASD